MNILYTYQTLLHILGLKEDQNDEIDNGFEVSSLPDYDTGELDGPEWKPIVNGSKLIKIGDITVPELRRMLLLKRRQKILNKNKYYIQQKVYITIFN